MGSTPAWGTNRTESLLKGLFSLAFCGKFWYHISNDERLGAPLTQTFIAFNPGIGNQAGLGAGIPAIPQHGSQPHPAAGVPGDRVSLIQ